MRQATFIATITDTTPGIITDLLGRTGDDPPSSQAKPSTALTSNNPVAGFTRLPMTPPQVALTSHAPGRDAASSPATSLACPKTVVMTIEIDHGN